jgi:putative transcriptional regulator
MDGLKAGLVSRAVPPSSCRLDDGMKNRIKELRARLDMTQEELARKAGVRRETIVFLEKGKYNPSLQLAHDVAKALKASNIEVVFVF